MILVKLTLALLATVAIAQNDDTKADDVWHGAAENQQIARSGSERAPDSERRYDDLKEIAKKSGPRTVSLERTDLTKRNTGPMVVIA